MGEFVMAQRWLVLAVYLLISSTNAWLMMTFVPVVYETKEKFGLTNEQVNWLSLIFVLVSVPGGLVAGRIIDCYGLRKMFVLASVLQCVGALLRLLAFEFDSSNKIFVILLCGNFICALAEPLNSWAPSKLAFVWFGPKERTLADSICSLSLPLGTMAGSLVGSLVVHDNEQALLPYMVSLAVYSLFVCGAVFLLCYYTDDAPSAPPSTTAAASIRNETDTPLHLHAAAYTYIRSDSISEVLKRIVRERWYLLLCICVGGLLGLFHIFVLMCPQLFCIYGYTTRFTAAGIVSVVVVSGFIGSLVVSLVAAKTGRHGLIFRTLYSSGGVMFICLILGNMYYKSTVTFIVFALGYGLLALPTYPLGNELGAEMVYPVSPTYAAGFIYMCGGIFGTIIGLVVNSMAKVVHTADYPDHACYLHLFGELIDYTRGMVFMACMAGPLLVASLFFRSRMRRSYMENFDRADTDDTKDIPVVSSRIYILSPRLEDPASNEFVLSKEDNKYPEFGDDEGGYPEKN